MEIPELNEIKIKVLKRDAAFTYFILESNEGVCFYSTLDDDFSLSPYRLIQVHYTPEFSPMVQHILKTLAQHFPLSIEQATML